MSASQSINRTMSLREWGMLLVLAGLWGGSFFFIAIAIKELPPFTIVACRVGIAALLLNAALFATGQRLPRSRDARGAFFGMGLLNNAIPFCLIVWGQSQIASGLAAILNASTPLFTVVVAHFLTADEKMSGNRLAGVIVGLVGVAVMIGPEALSGLGGTVLAQFAIVLASVAYAVSSIFGRRFQRMRIPPMVTSTGQLTASSLMLVPVALFADHPWALPMPSLGAMAAVFAIASVSTAFAYIIFFRILGSAGATNIVLVTFLVPVSAVLLGALILH